MTCLQLANHIGLFFSSTTVPMPQSGCFIIQLPRRVLRVYWLGYLPGSVCRERVSGASSLVCAGLKAWFTRTTQISLRVAVPTPPTSRFYSGLEKKKRKVEWLLFNNIHNKITEQVPLESVERHKFKFKFHATKTRDLIGSYAKL